MPSKRVSLKGKGADLFFGGSKEPTPPEDRDAEAQLEERLTPEAISSEPDERANSLTDAPAELFSGKVPDAASDDKRYRASTIASDDEVTEAIRRIVKRTGREVSFVRLSAEEKGRLADIVYTYKRQGVRTSENEINRIAINLLLEDYDANGGASVLARVLAALRS